MSYPKVVKEAALEKMFHTDLSFREIGDQLGIPRATLHTWKKQYHMDNDTKDTIQTPAESWSPEEKFAVEYRRRDAHPDEDEVALDEGDLDVAFLTDDALDLSRLAAEQVLLALPMRAVCDDECAGLCPRCGANRNVQGACRCEPDTDPRWEALRGLAGSDTAN